MKVAGTFSYLLLQGKLMAESPAKNSTILRGPTTVPSVNEAEKSRKSTILKDNGILCFMNEDRNNI